MLLINYQMVSIIKNDDTLRLVHNTHTNVNIKNIVGSPNTVK